VPHDGYSPERPAALYAVPVRPHITTQEQFKEEHASYYMQRTHSSTTKEERKAAKEERKAAKRAKLIIQYGVGLEVLCPTCCRPLSSLPACAC
jgi:hypothetical protein